MLTVHHLNNSRSQRVLWLLEELGTPYALIRYERTAEQRAPEALRRVHPLGHAPILTDESGLVLAETGAIVAWLRHGFDPEGRLGPAPGSPAWADYLYWVNAAEGTAMPPLVMGLVLSAAATKAPVLVRPVVRAIRDALQQKFCGPQIAGVLDLAERDLAARGWFAGDVFSAADIMMSFPIEAANARMGLGARPALRGWLDRIHARPGYRAALARGGQYDYA